MCFYELLFDIDVIITVGGVKNYNRIVFGHELDSKIPPRRHREQIKSRVNVIITYNTGQSLFRSIYVLVFVVRARVLM